MFLGTANNINFYYRTNSAKINDQIFNKFKKPCFLPIFPILRTKIFSGKSGYVKRKFIWISGTMPKFRKKLMIQLQENARPGGRTEGMMERRTDLIFLGPFQLPPVGPKTSNGFQLLFFNSAGYGHVYI